MGCIAIALLSSCGSPAASGDAGNSSPDTSLPSDDAGPTPELDGGAGDDAATGEDSGPMVCGTLVGTAGRFPDLPATCLPRCTMATATTIAACTSQSCIDDAANFDMTPSVAVVMPSGMPRTFGCSDCVNWQTNGCREEACPAEVAAAFACLDANPGDPTPCGDQTLALNNCVSASMTALSTCVARRVRSCFP